jgi:hypothetical protein
MSRDKHHRRCRSNGGSNAKSNLSFVKSNQHRAYHLLFQNFQAPRIAQLLNEVWIDPDWELVARRRK